MTHRVSGPARLIAFAVLLAIGCQASPPDQGSRGGTTAAGQSYRVDMDVIFPAGEGRDLVLGNCQSCHIWVPIVILQMNEEEWARSQLEHRGRVEALSDENFETLYEYLVTTFTPDRPVPELPPALLEAWTSY